VGALVEIPRACLIAGQVAKSADFFSFGNFSFFSFSFFLQSCRRASNKICEKLRNGVLSVLLVLFSVLVCSVYYSDC